ncbi:MAG: hypothetical protein JNM74_02580 [Myxococcales bacterium]|nr:hypothetical protein [Myxococcales bacterium]
MSDLRCPTCGGTLTPMDMAKPSCTYCGTVLPHHARAAQQVAVVNQMMADRNGNGIPDAFEGLIANAPHGQVHLIGTSVQVGPGAHPPVTPFGGGNPMGAVHLQQVAVAQSVARTSSLVTVIVVVSMVFMMVIGGVVAGIVAFTAVR